MKVSRLIQPTSDNPRKFQRESVTSEIQLYRALDKYHGNVLEQQQFEVTEAKNRNNRILTH